MNLKNLFGSANDRYLKKFKKTVEKINALEPEISALSDAELQAKTPAFRERLTAGETLDDLLPEAFAVVREAAKRTLGLRPFDVQLLGGIVLHNGKIAEMRTGEGKTLVATLPVYLNALTGKGVHVVTVNDYLAKRDSEWMGRIYRFLGLTVGCLTHELDDKARKEVYACDITYATNNELGFDYLRDNMRLSVESMVQRPFYYAIVDEVDSILIDEARTPLIISGPAEDSSDRYRAVDKLMSEIRPEHYEKDEKRKNVTLTEAGNEFIESRLNASGLMQGGLYETENIPFVHYVEQALRAHTMFTRDVDYLVKDGKVMIIDEFTGRIMDGRRYSDGLHQALEAKEGVEIQPENQTIASITFQNYFRLYPKLAGMTGTAMTEAAEFDSTYHLDVIAIPPNKPSGRIDEQDVIYRTAAEKYDAIIDEIIAAHKRQQPILVGTTSIEKSELLADLLKKKADFPFAVLNARHHEKEAQIVAQAGRPGAVTIATNMAGRGTDIQLGGSFEMRLAEEKALHPDANEAELAKQIRAEIEQGKEIALKAGGLYVLGSERHESRRIDNQLRGRSGRQGDPGLSKFYVSMQDDLMRIFGSERIGNILKTMGMPTGQAIVHPWISKAIAKAQQKVEGFHFDVRKNLLEFDGVMNDQRKVIYEQRRELMAAKDVDDVIRAMREDCVQTLVYGIAPDKSVPADWDVNALTKGAGFLLDLDAPFASWVAEPGITPEDMIERLCDMSEKAVAQKMAILPPDIQQDIKKNILIQAIDQNWKEHLQMLDFLKNAVRWRTYGQQIPITAYKQEAFRSFEGLLSRVREQVVRMLAFAEFRIKPVDPQPEAQAQDNDTPRPIPENIGRNAPCPCGSGKKYKHCCGKLK